MSLRLAIRFLALAAAIAVSLLEASCSGCVEYDDQGGMVRPTRDDFIRYNRHLFWCDSTCIAQYSDSLGLEVKPTPSYLWLTIHDKGTGAPISKGEKVTLEYAVSTLLGDTIYSSTRDGNMTLTVGRMEVNEGLDEALLCLCHGGARATAILIPDKAFGVKGDGNRIHGRVILRYDIHLLD